jgi:hypothetical protein
MPHILTQCSRETPTGIVGFWRPRPSDVMAAEGAVDRTLIAALDSVFARDTAGTPTWRTDSRATWPERYYRQYAGLRQRDGRRTIYVNGFSSGWPRELSERVAQADPAGAHPLAQPGWWRFTAASVCDGGELYFGAVYDPASDRVLSFRFNVRD